MKILIGYDGSECADDAIYGLKRAGLPDEAEALVISVGEHWLFPLPVPGPGPAELIEASTGKLLELGGEIDGRRAECSGGF